MPSSFWEGVLFLLKKYGMYFLRGAGNTMLVALVGTTIGFFIGLLIGTLRTIPLSVNGKKGITPRRVLLRVVNAIAAVYVEVIRGTPMMVQAMVFFYGIPLVFGVFIDALPAAFIIVSINTGAYMAEITRGGISAVPAGQTEAAKAIGMSHWKTMRHVVLPQTILNILPATGNEFVINIKDTSVLSVITLGELFYAGRSVAGIHQRYFETFILIAAIYLVLTFPITRILRLLERRIMGADTFTLATSSTMPQSILRKNGGHGAYNPKGR